MKDAAGASGATHSVSVHSSAKAIHELVSICLTQTVQLFGIDKQLLQRLDSPLQFLQGFATCLSNISSDETNVVHGNCLCSYVDIFLLLLLLLIHDVLVGIWSYWFPQQ